MGILSRGDKPTRAERKAQKAADKAALKQEALDARELAREEKRAAKASRSFWGRKKRDDVVELDVSERASPFAATAEGKVSDDPEAVSTVARDIAPEEPDEFLLEDRVVDSASDDPGPEEGPRLSTEQSHVISEPVSDEDPERSYGLHILKRKTEPDLVGSVIPQGSGAKSAGTQVRPMQASQESFAALRRAVCDPKPGPNDVLVLDDPVDEARSSDLGPSHSHAEIEPLRLEDELIETVAEGFSENWIGLWISEDGAAIYIEEDEDDWFAVTVMPDPKSTCYSGPQYPEIQSHRMPASYSREELGEFDGERLSVITVPGLPGGHRSPMMYIYFLTAIPAAEGGGNRFATPQDTTRRVFIAADFELGTVNPWSEYDDIEWIDPSVNFYKAPGKLDAYMMRRMSTDDPLN
jgi:hypothetical protein